MWGYGVACGSQNGDLKEPRRTETRRQNIIEVAGGMYHSAALTGIYVCCYSSYKTTYLVLPLVSVL